jgi:hypothetical protein
MHTPPPAGHVLPPPGHLLPARGGHGGGALEPRGSAGDGDPAGVLEPELLLGLAQQLPEQRVVEVHHGHHVPHRLPELRAADVHRHLTLGRGGLRGLLVGQELHPPRQGPAPRQHLRRADVVMLLLLPGAEQRRRGARLQAEVPAVAAARAVAERPAPGAEQLPAEPESSVSPREHSARERSPRLCSCWLSECVSGEWNKAWNGSDVERDNASCLIL